MAQPRKSNITFTKLNNQDIDQHLCEFMKSCMTVKDFDIAALEVEKAERYFKKTFGGD